MAEQQLTIDSNNNQNNQDNNLDNLELQTPEERMIRIKKKMTGYVVCLSIISGIQIYWYLFMWIIANLDFSFSYNYKTHKYGSDKKYVNNVNIFTLPCLALTIICICTTLSFFRGCNPTATIILTIIFIGIKIPLYYFYCESLFEAAGSTLSIISVSLECSFVFIIMIFEMVKSELLKDKNI